MAYKMIDPRRANTPYWVGKSTDSKPLGVSIDSRLYEGDTGIWRSWTGDEWVELRAAPTAPFADVTLFSIENGLETIAIELFRIRRLLELTTGIDTETDGILDFSAIQE